MLIPSRMLDNSDQSKLSVKVHYKEKLQILCNIYQYVTHKEVAEVSKIGNL